MDDETRDDAGEKEEGRRRICQACFRRQAENHCQACRRFICDDCVAPPADDAGATGGDDLEQFLQATLVRCKACRDDEVRLPPHDLQFEPGSPSSS